MTIDPAGGPGNAAHSITGDETNGTVMADANNSFVPILDGNTTATLTCNGCVGGMGLALNTAGRQCISQNNTVVVTAYGAVGGFITGTFIGTVVRSNGPSAGTQATIGNGTLRFRRVSDV